MADIPMCPKCGNVGEPSVVELVDVHFVVMDQSGPIKGLFGRQYVACQPKREYLAAHQWDQFSASDDPRAVTCPSCQGTKAWREMANLFPETRLEMALRKQASGGMRVIDPHCGSCG